MSSSNRPGALIPPPPPPPPPPSQQSISSSNTSAAMTKTNSKQSSAADAEVDLFLSSQLPIPSSVTSTSTSNSTTNNEENPPKLPQLKPKPLRYTKNDTSNSNRINLLLELVSRRAWNDVIKLSDDLLFSSTSIYQSYCSQLMNMNDTTSGIGIETGTNMSVEDKEKTQNLIQVLQWRMRSMFHLRRHNDLKLYIEKMNLTYSKYRNGELPSWVPLSLLLQSMECIALSTSGTKQSNDKSNGNSNEGEGKEKDDDEILDEFYMLRKGLVEEKIINIGHNVDNNEENDGRKWKLLLQLDIILSNILTRNKEWRLALVTLEEIIGYSEEVATYWAETASIRTGGSSVLLRNTIHIVSKSILIEMYSRQGRVLLQAGALPAAATVFERAHDENQALESSGIIEKVVQKGLSPDNTGTGGNIVARQKIVKNIPTQILINEGLLHFAHMDYDLAEVKFNKAIQLQRKEQEKEVSLEVEQHEQLQDGSFLNNSIETEGDLLVPCLNNFALCALYTCRMREAIALMESLIREDPARYLTHCVVFNLCTLYELGWDNTMSDRKKRVLQLVAKRFSLHDVGVESFRLS
jgi:tetratricopeptide (TPR) repeat protein